MEARCKSLWAAGVALAVCLGGVGGAAAVGPGVTFQGQLLDGGAPRNGTCDFRFQLFGVAGGGSPIGGLTEDIPSVQVQNGLFNVILNSTGELGPDAFSGGDRWLEISVRCPAGGGAFSAPFSPRQAITAAPYAQYVPPNPPAATRFTDNGDGTVTDHTTGLMWEMKTGTPGTAIDCSKSNCDDPRDVNNRYEWCEDQDDNNVCDHPGIYSDNPPDGGLFADFLARTNGMFCDDPIALCTGLGGHKDWRVPTIGELNSILPSPCPGYPCIDPIFGPTALDGYWSSSHRETNNAWLVGTGSGASSSTEKWFTYRVRAVRGGL